MTEQERQAALADLRKWARARERVGAQRDEVILAAIAAGIERQEIAATMGISRQTIYRLEKKGESDGEA